MRPAVWAPRAGRVDLVLDGGATHGLVAGADGWHRSPADGPDGPGAPALAHGDRYAFSLDGGAPLPDPRSRWQPDGIDGPSAVDDPTRFRWSDAEAGWRGFHLPGAVLYELHVGTFTAAGTFDGAIERLDHLVDLGVDAVELLPVAEFMGDRGWGYDGVDLWAPHHRYGGPDGLRRLVDACHRRGLGVLLDVVYNHLGPRGNHLDRFGPYIHDDGVADTPWGQAVNLDGPGSTEVRRFILDNAHHWFVDHHVDGLRLDATHALVDRSPQHVLAELSEATEALAAHLRRPLWLIAEREQEELLPVLAREAGGWGLHARWADDLHHAVHAALTGERDGYYADFDAGLADIATAVTEGHVRPGDAIPDSISAHRSVVCVQNHDQVGNRARGERLADLVGPEMAMAAAAILLCSPGTPLLFAGEEWAASSPFPYFCDPPDAELAAAVTDGRRAEFAAFGWADTVPDPVDPATMASAVLRWDERASDPHDRVLAWCRTLLRLRRARPDLTDGRRTPASVAVDVDQAARTLVLRRARTAVVVNLGDEDRRIEVGATELLACSGGGGRAPVIGPDGDVTIATVTTAVVAVEGRIEG